MSNFPSAYLSARITVFAKRLLGFEQLTSLIGLDFDQIVAKITELTGRTYLINQETSRIENHLTSMALNDFQILIRPYSGSERRFFFYAIRWFELANLKVLIRGKFSSTDNAKIEQQLVDLGDFADLPLARLLETEDPYEMLRLLETTAYVGIVRQARHVLEEHGNDLFLLDATIDRSFFLDLNQRIRFLQPRDAEAVGRLMGTLLDRFNLLWLLRYRFSYGLSPAKSYFLLTASGNKLHSAELMRLAKMETIEEVVAKLPWPFQQLLDGLGAITDIETMMEYFSLSIAAKSLSNSTNQVARTLAYILLREAEVRFLQAMLKGKQLGFTQDLIRQAVGAQH